MGVGHKCLGGGGGGDLNLRRVDESIDFGNHCGWAEGPTAQTCSQLTRARK